MAGPYYCDIGETTFADSVGTAEGTAYTGPAGLQAAFRGTGNATALAAGETLYIKGDGNLSRLVLLDCNGTDVSAWAPTNVVRNLDGAGDDWTGVVVQANDDPVGQLGADDLVLVWLDTGKTEDDIDLDDGIENTTLAENADPLAAKSTPGIRCDTASGTAGSEIIIEGQNGSWVTDGTRPVLDGNLKATHCFASVGKADYICSNIEFKNAASDNVTVITASASRWHFVNCHSHHAGNDGWGPAGGLEWYSCQWTLCIANNCADGFDVFVDCVFLLCSAHTNTNGFTPHNGAFFDSCLAYSNTGVGYYYLRQVSSLVNCVSDGNASGMYICQGNVTVKGCRITNNTVQGIYGDGSGSYLDLYNFYNSNNGVDIAGTVTAYPEIRGASTRITTGTIGYEDAGNDKYNLRLGAAGYRNEIDIDGSGNYVRFPMGLPTMILPKLSENGGMQ